MADRPDAAHRPEPRGPRPQEGKADGDRPADDDDGLLDPNEMIDVTEPTADGEPIHRTEGGDVGDGAD